jgi:hypothetical protein
MKKSNIILPIIFCLCSILSEIYIFKRYINAIKNERNREFVESDDKYIKFKKYYTLMNKWFVDKCNNISIEIFFENAGYKDIAVYGIGELGKNLLLDLKRGDINVKYIIDKSAEYSCIGMGEYIVHDLNDNLEDVDVVIVTPIANFDEIKKVLEEKIKCPIISLEDVIGVSSIR